MHTRYARGTVCIIIIYFASFTCAIVHISYIRMFFYKRIETFMLSLFDHIVDLIIYKVYVRVRHLDFEI